jgi:hypothetical protein
MALLRRGDTYLMYVGHLWHRGWSVIDITSPEDAHVVGFIEGPPNTWTGQVDVTDELLVTGLERIPEGWGGDEHGSFAEGMIVWDLQDPLQPIEIGRYHTGSAGTHRNSIGPEGLVHLAAHSPGKSGRLYQVVDCRAGGDPKLVGSFGLPEQSGPVGNAEGISLHGPPVPVDDLVYLPYGRAGLVVVRGQSDSGDFEEVGRLGFSPPFLGHIGVHSVVPLRGGQLLLACSETVQEDCQDALGHISLIDGTAPEAMRLLSVFPVPQPTPEEGFPNYCMKGGRFGPHNIYQHRHNVGASQDEDLVFATYFNAGLRVYDIADPLLPREIAFFVPPDPENRYGPQPKGRLVAQTEDVIVDDRGFIFASHKNQGIWCLRLKGDSG